METYVHPKLNEPVEFFGGTYLFVSEGVIDFHGKEVVYLLGFASIEASCCGRGGSAFIKVPGFLGPRRDMVLESSRVSDIERIVDEGCQREITVLFREKFPAFRQVDFL